MPFAPRSAALSDRCRLVSYMAFWVFAWLFSGGATWTVGSFTSASCVPTLTEPVWTSNAGAWPPVAVTPLSVAAIVGTLPPRTWLMLRKPLATAMMIVLRAGGVRSKDADEYDGLDLAEHDVNAHPDFQQTMIKSYHLREA